MIGQQFGHFEVGGQPGLRRDGRRLSRPGLAAGSARRHQGSLGRPRRGRAARTRFRREAQALSRLNHPNIATIYDFDQQEGRDFLVMEYIERQSLRDDAVGRPLPPAEVVRLGTQLAEALVAAHGAGVVHLDVKPGNLMLTPDGRLKVLDFGIARLHACDDETTRPHRRRR